MKSKRFLPLLIIAIIIPTLLSSCGDTGEPLVDSSIDVDRCYLNAYDVSGNLLSSVIVRDAEADDLYRYFAKSGYISQLGAEYDLTDFSEVNCLRAGVLLEGDNSVWWTLIIESESEKEILEAKNHLEAREDILSVTLDYIMRID